MSFITFMDKQKQPGNNQYGQGNTFRKFRDAINPFKIPSGIQRLLQIQRSKRDLGQLEEKTAHDTETIEKLSRQTYEEIFNIVKRTGTLIGMVWLGANIYHNYKGTESAERPAVSAPRVAPVKEPIDAFLKNIDPNPRTIPLKTAVDPISIHNLETTHHTVFGILDVWAERLTKEADDTAFAKVLLTYAREHGQPRYLTQAKNNPDYDQFSYDMLSADNEKGPGHKWFKKNNLFFYDAENKNFYIVFPDLPQEETPEKEAERQFKWGIIGVDLWFALADIHSHGSGGNVQYMDLPMEKVLTKGVATSFYKILDVFIANIDVKDKGTFRVSLQKTVRLLQSTGSKFVDMQDVVLDKILDAKTIENYKQTMGYRIARFALAQNSPDIARIKPALLYIVQNPHVLDK